MKLDWTFLYRKKTIDLLEENDGNKLPRVLTVFDLTALGTRITLSVPIRFTIY